MELSGRTAIVTGGARGVGRGIAWELAKRGTNVVIADLLTVDVVAHAAEATVAGAVELGVQSVAMSCDVRDSAQLDAVVAATVERFGAVEIGCSNAGVIRESTLADGSADDWRFVLDVNLTGTFLFAKSLTPQLISQKSGTFIAVSSVAAFRGGPGYTAYCASKAGVLGFVRAMASELAPHNVRANAICPGYLATDMWFDDILPTMGAGNRAEQFDAVIAAEVPLRRPQTPADIGHAAVYLCQADNVTGIAMTVDGGHVAGP